EIGGIPILWHIMKIFSHYGCNDFVLCLGYKGKMIKEYFLNFEWLANDFTLQMGKGKGKITHHAHSLDNWNITFADTGESTETGGRIKRVEKYIRGDDFFITYGDGVADVNIKALYDFHKRKKKVLTITGIHPPSRFGILDVNDGMARSFSEKPALEGLVNGGFMAASKKLFDYLDEDCVFEQKPMRKLAAGRQLAVFEHKGFWQCMDTFKEVEAFNRQWDRGIRPWVVWE
ncbi:MAG: sugar phosphate nucleotidyltransferase, partial [Nitrospiraceae bacterium]|nr:sugar phosphate nucleotidyltransferase [Nitrospiraceae bacterium]